jgi:solute carrier family 25 (mitochondrial iron transporter), member 28/37
MHYHSAALVKHQSQASQENSKQADQANYTIHRQVYGKRGQDSQSGTEVNDLIMTTEMQLNDADWEKWDGSSPFWIHCAAGSLAGVMEHTTVYPLDTARTHIQVCASCMHRHPASLTNSSAAIPGVGISSVKNALVSNAVLRKQGCVHQNHLPAGVWQTMRFLLNETPASKSNVGAASAVAKTPSWSSLVATKLRDIAQGHGRLWRGVQMTLIGSIPADGLYFCSYEAVKAATVDPQSHHITTWGSSLAGAAAVVAHDVIMTPLDTMKQRMQLGHYQDGVIPAFRSILQTEGWRAFYVSLPITLVTNIPYGMVMVSTHEVCKHAWSSEDRPVWQTVLLASSLAGLTASAVTTPLDRIKTALQTQELAPTCFVKDTTLHYLRPEQVARENTVAPRFSRGASSSSATCNLRHDTWLDAAMCIYRTEGMGGFARGLVPRILSHTPAVAIAWTTYETVKHALVQHYHYCG